jgi:hypothetical protein
MREILLHATNSHDYKMSYYLCDGFYPPWAPFIKTIFDPTGGKISDFSQRQEEARKDVEWAFGLLQAGCPRAYKL